MRLEFTCNRLDGGHKRWLRKSLRAVEGSVGRLSGDSLTDGAGVGKTGR
jgi:hypothetical protein